MHRVRVGLYNAFLGCLAALLLAGPARAQQDGATGVVEINLSAYSDSVYVIVNERWNEARLVGQQERLRLPAGVHRVRIVPAAGPSNVLRTRVLPSDTARFKVAGVSRTAQRANPEFARLALGADVLLALEPGQTAYARGEALGAGPLLLSLPSEGERVRVVDRGGAERELDLQPQPGPLAVHHVPLRPRRSAVQVGYFVPGLYQHATGRHWGLALTAATGIGAVVGAGALVRADADATAYADARADYLGNRVEAEFAALFDRAESARSRAQASARARNIALGALGGLVALHFADVLLRPYRGGYRAPIDVGPIVDPSSGSFGAATVVRL